MPDGQVTAKTTSSGAADYEVSVAAEYLEEARDIVNALDIAVGQARAGETAGGTFDRVLADVTRLRGLGRYAENHLADITVHRLHDYLNDTEAPGEGEINDLETFADILRGVLDGEIDHDSADYAEFARALPVRRSVDIEDLLQLDVEIMLVEQNNAGARIVKRELQSCGYRVTSVSNALDAIALAVRTRPDLVVSSVMLDDLDGVDLACALAAMPSTRDIPFALLTSFDRRDTKLRDLPARAALIKKGPQFGADLAETLSRYGIT